MAPTDPAGGTAAARSYDGIVSGAATRSDLLVWFKLTDATDARGLIGRGTPSGRVGFTGERLPDTSAGASAIFDGADGFIGIPDNDQLRLATGTLIAFVRPAAGSLAGRRGIFQMQRPATNDTDFGVHWWGDTQELVFEIMVGGVPHQCRAKNTLSEGVPACIIATWGETGDAGREMKLRVNKQIVATTSHTGGVPARREGWLVGCRGPSGTQTHFWHGLISHVQIYRRVLNEVEIDALCPLEPTAALAAIGRLRPVVYYPLTSASALDHGSARLALVERGPVPAKTSKGWDVADGAWLEVAHAAAFETDLGTPDRWVDSEVAVIAEFRVESLAARTSLLSKSDGTQPGTAWHVDVETDGSIAFHAAVPHKRVSVFAPAGTVAAGQRFHLALLFGRAGLQMYVDGAPCEDGWPRLAHWYGWDHRLLGNEAEVQGERWVNRHPFRIGHNGTDAKGRLLVRHVAVFVTGGENVDPWVRTGTRMSRREIEAVAGKAPAGPLRSRWQDGATINVPSDQPSLEAALAVASPGDTIVLPPGTQSMTASARLLDRLRITGAGKGSTIISFAAGGQLFSDGASWLDQSGTGGNSGDWPAGTARMTLSGHHFAAGDIMVVVGRVKHAHDVNEADTSGVSDNAFRSQMVEVLAVSGSTVELRQPLRMDFPAAKRASLWRLRPGASHVYLENLTVRGTDPESGKRWQEGAVLRLFGMVDVRLRNVAVEQTATTNDHVDCRVNGVVGFEADGCDFDTAAANGSQANHPYSMQMYAGGDLVLKGCTSNSEGWTAYDRGHRNVGRQIGGGGGPSELIQCVLSDLVDCTGQTTRGRSSSNGLGIGGHTARFRRDVAVEVGNDRGYSCGAWAANNESNGIRLATQFFAAFGSRWWYAHHVRSSTGGDARMYRSFRGDINRDAIMSHVVHDGTDCSRNWTGTYVNWKFRNCTPPVPPST